MATEARCCCGNVCCKTCNTCRIVRNCTILLRAYLAPIGGADPSLPPKSAPPTGVLTMRTFAIDVFATIAVIALSTTVLSTFIA